MNIKMLKAAFAGLALSICGFANAGIIYDESIDGNIAQNATIDLAIGLNTITGQSCWFSSCNEYNWYITLEEGSYLSEVTYSWSIPTLVGSAASWNGRYGLWDGSFNDIFPQQNWLLGGGSFIATFDKDELSYEAVGSSTFGFLYGGNRTSSGGAWDFTASFNVVSSATDVPEPSTLAIFALGIMGLASRRFKKQ